MATRYTVTEGNREVEIEIVSDDGEHAVVQMGDRILRVQTRTLPSGAIGVQCDGARRTFRSWRDAAGLHVTQGDAVRTYEVMDERSMWLAGARGGQSLDGGRVVASMPGRVVGLAVSEGEVVEEGAVVAVLEAMKMENDVRTPMGGRVVEVAVQTGVAVESGQLLLRIEAID